MTDLTLKTYHERINVILQYIDNHLEENLDLDFLAGLSFYSPFHFHRIMKAYLGESLGNYIQRTRVNAGIQLLRYSDISISDIAYKIGYDTPASFNKVFKKRFGVTPGYFRGCLDFQLPFNRIIKQKIDMKNLTPNPDIRTIKDFKVIYVTAIGKYGDHNTESAWKTVCGFAGRYRLFGPETQFLGISYDDPKFTEPDKCRYEACVSVKENIKPDGKVGCKVVSGGKYAVFKLIGPLTMLAPSYDYIYGNWVLQNNIELADKPCFEKYLNSPDRTPPEKLETEIWIPLK